MSGGHGGSGRPLLGLEADLRGLDPTALAVLAVAVDLAANADPPGVVPAPAVATITRILGLHRRTIRRHLGVLEGRRLLRRHHRTSATVLLVDALGTPVSQGAGRIVERQDFRELRARVGGLQRAIKEAMAERDAAAAEAQELRRARRLEANASLVGLLVDLEHATDCVDVDCERCLEIGRKVETARPEWTAEAEIVERLQHADALRAAGQALLGAMRDQGVGAMARRATAARAFATLLEPG